MIEISIFNMTAHPTEMTYFTVNDADNVFLRTITADHVRFFYCAGRDFVRLISKHSWDVLTIESYRVIDAYKTAFRSRQSTEQLYKDTLTTVATLDGDTTVTFSYPKIELELTYKNNGPYSSLATTIIKQRDIMVTLMTDGGNVITFKSRSI